MPMALVAAVYALASFSILCSSSRASPIRSLSLLSTTKMRPWVFWK